MINRFVRLIVFFDLPMETSDNNKEYRYFRKFLIKNGFIMMQKSVYSKLVINRGSSMLVKEKIKQNLPSSGLVELLEITEKQFAGIEYLLGKSNNKILNSVDRVIIFNSDIRDVE